LEQMMFGFHHSARTRIEVKSDELVMVGEWRDVLVRSFKQSYYISSWCRQACGRRKDVLLFFDQR
jgi:hypothetical protein